MRILQVISYGYLAGGAEKSAALLKESLRERGHTVAVISSDHDRADASRHFSDIEFAEIDSPGTSLFTKTIRHLWHRPSYRAIKSTIAEFRPDIVHFHTMGQLSPSALFAIGKVPGLLTVHGPEEYTTDILEWGFPRHLFKNHCVAVTNLTLLGKAYYLYFCHVQRPLYVWGFRKHLVTMLAPSHYMTDVLKKEAYGVPVQHVYNGIKLPIEQPLQNTKCLLYVGRLEHVKGVGVLLTAMLDVIPQLPDIHLVIVGDGTIRPELEAFVTQHQLQGHVTFRGWLQPTAVIDQYARTTAVVIPSIWPENLPTVCIEALATGRPVIGTSGGGISELVQDGVTGHIVAADDPDALATAIVSLLSRRNISVTACASSVQDFQITTFVHNMEKLYRRLLDNTLEEV